VQPFAVFPQAMRRWCRIPKGWRTSSYWRPTQVAQRQPKVEGLRRDRIARARGKNKALMTNETYPTDVSTLVVIDLLNDFLRKAGRPVTTY